MRKIAIEEAFITKEIMEQWGLVLKGDSVVDLGFKKMGETILSDSPGTHGIHKRLLDLGEARIRDMDIAGIDTQVISLTSPGVQVLSDTLAVELAADANNQLFEAVQRYPSRFVGLTAVSPWQPELAAQEIQRASSQLGFRGVIINSHTGGEYMDATKYWPIFEAAESLSMPIYLHPNTPSKLIIQPFLDFDLYGAIWGFAADASLHAMRLIMSGVFDQFPGLKIILGHMGEGIPFWLDRIDNRHLLWQKVGSSVKLKHLPSEYFKNNFYISTSGMCYQAPFELALKTLGVDNILFAADYPYEDVQPAVNSINTFCVTEEIRKKIFHENAEHVFRMST